jgi:hypothetical protein
LIPGDFDGDGLVDIGIARGGVISVYHSTGGFFDVARETWLRDPIGNITRMFAGDIDGNGKAACSSGG